ncbi:MAG: ATP-binding protein [Bacteroidales bacterium]
MASQTERSLKFRHKDRVAFTWPFALLLSLLFLTLFEPLLYLKQQNLRKDEALEALSFGNDLIARFDRELNTLINLSSGLEAYIKVHGGNLDSAEFQQYLKEICGNSTLIRNIGVAQGTLLKYVEPLAGNEKAIGVDYKTVANQWPVIEYAIKMRKGTLAGPVDLIQGGRALIYRLPVYVDDQYWGLLSTVINIDQLFGAAFKELTNQRYEFAIRLDDTYKPDEKRVLFGNAGLFNIKNSVLSTAGIPNGTWEYVIVPQKTSAASFTIRLIEYAGIFFAIMLFFLFNHVFKLRKQNREAFRKLKRSEALLQTIMDTALSGITILDKNGYQIFANKTIEQIHGYTLEEIMGKHFSMFTHPDDVERGSQKLMEIFEGKIDSYDGEFRLFHKKTNEIVWIHVVASRFPGKFTNDEDSALLFYQNVTKQKENESKLQELNATKDKFFSIIAHDLRNPFVALMGLSEYLLAKYNKLDHEDHRKKLELMHESAQQTYQLLENLLTWALSQSGGIKFNLKKVLLPNVVNNSIKVLSALAFNKSIEIINKVEKDQYLFADAYMLETILRSLISNAIKFTPREGRITVGMAGNPGDKFSEIYVEDTGVGIAEETLNDLFRIDKSTTTCGTEKEKGSGLGLILCKEFVEKHGGRIRAESSVGKGSRFSFTIPATKHSKN